VLRAFAAATLIRPAVMFGPDDAFVAPLLSMLRRLPAFPLFGTGGPGCSRSMSRILAKRSPA